MKTTVYCKTVAKDTLGFFARIGNRDYFLFNQPYKKSLMDFFYNGATVNAINDYTSAHSTAVRRTLDKLPSYIKYIEKEYDVAIYEKTKALKTINKKAYKRQSFRWQDYSWAV